MPASMGGVVSVVRPEGIGAEVGIEPGDVLASVNGHRLHDVVDYQFYTSDERLDLVVERAGELHSIAIERDLDEDLGLEFCSPLFDALRECSNQCPFCFVRQMPRGMRRTLCLRDDDYRLSFLTGNYITLTNLNEADWKRIGEQRLSPLYVSVHATDTALRRRMLGNAEAPDVLAQLRRLGDLGIEVNAQIVVVPGWNDGEALQRSIADLAGLWPTVCSLAIVPVGLTRYHRGGLRVLTPEEAREILTLVDECGAPLRHRAGRTWVFPSDEMYLLAGVPVPDAEFYDDDAQRENGVGLVRELLDDWTALRADLESGWARRKHGRSQDRRATLVCGTLIAPVLAPMATELGALAGVDLQAVPVENVFFGANVTVSGLLTGADVVAALRGRDLGERVFLPDVMFAPGEDDAHRVTLDELRLEDLAAQWGVAVSLAGVMSDVASSLLAKGGRRRRAQSLAGNPTRRR